MLKQLSHHWQTIQTSLFPYLKDALGPLSKNHQRLATLIDFLEMHKFIPSYYRSVGRPQKYRVVLAHAFLAKVVYNLPTTRSLIERLQCDPKLRRLCGFQTLKSVPSEATFSRAFEEFADLGLAQKAHDAFIKNYHSNRIIGHISRDSTAIHGREKAIYPSQKPQSKGKKDKSSPIQNRIERQKNMSLEEMLDDLPKHCDIGTKINSKGHKKSWKGYKGHVDTMDGDIPVSYILTSASVHDSQGAIPLSEMTGGKIIFLYDLMDSAYDAQSIRSHIEVKGRVPIIDFNRRSPSDTRCFADHEKERYKERSSAERVNSNLKDNFGGRFVRVRGFKKVLTHIGFGLLAIAVEQTLRLLS